MWITKDWYHNPDDVLSRLEKLLRGIEIAEEPEPPDQEAAESAPFRKKSEEPQSTTSHPGEGKPSPTEIKDSPSPPQVPASTPSSGSARHFEFIGGSSRKFWEMSVSGNSFTVRFGRIGTAGQSQTKTFADDATAKREAEKLIAEKLKKGYAEKA